MAYNINIYGNCNDVVRNIKTTSFTTYAPKGDNGPDGERGTSLYFTNYDLQNDYYKDIVIRKISNNMMLSSDADIKQEGREYIDGDLVLCSDKSIYMIKNTNDVYDIEFIGKLHDDNITKDFKDKIINVLIEIESCNGAYSNVMPAYRYINSRPHTSFIKIKPSIFTIGDTNHDYYMRIHLYNKKTLQLGDYAFREDLSGGNNEFDLSLSNNAIEFFKTIEFPIKERRKNDNGEFDAFGADITDAIYIPEMVFDKLHPSGNNIDIKSTWESDKYNVYYDDNTLKYLISFSTQQPFTNDMCYEQLHTRVQFETKKLSDNDVHINFRGGESCYFSGMTHGCDTLEVYADNIDNDYSYIVTDEMINFLTSEKNIYELICVNKLTHKTEIVDFSNTNINFKIIRLNEQ